MYLRYSMMLGQETTAKTVANRKGQQGKNPTRASAKPGKICCTNTTAAEEFAPPQRPGTPTIHGQMEVSIMVAVKEFSWEEVSSPDFGARAAWREAVAAIAEKAKAKLPECNGRVDSAVKI